MAMLIGGMKVWANLGNLLRHGKAWRIWTIRTDLGVSCQAQGLAGRDRSSFYYLFVLFLFILFRLILYRGKDWILSSLSLALSAGDISRQSGRVEAKVRARENLPS